MREDTWCTNGAGDALKSGTLSPKPLGLRDGWVLGFSSCCTPRAGERLGLGFRV